MIEDFGYIYKIHENKVVILTPTRGFITIKKRNGMELGQRVYFEKNEIVNSRKFIYYLASVAAILLISFMSLYFFSWNVNPIYGYVDVDINPSIDFAVDKNYKVLKAMPMNDDAEKVLKSCNFSGKRLDDAINTLLDKSEYYGYLKHMDKNVVIVSISLANINKKNSVPDTGAEKKLDLFINNIKELNQKNIIKQTLRVSSDERNAAIKNGISMGKYSMYLKAKERDEGITIEEVKSINNFELMELAGISLVSLDNKNNKTDNTTEENTEPKKSINIVAGTKETPPLPEQNTTQVQKADNNTVKTDKESATDMKNVSDAKDLTKTKPASGETASTNVQNTKSDKTQVNQSDDCKVRYNFENDNAKNYCISDGGKLFIMNNRHYDGSNSIMAQINHDGEITFYVTEICQEFAPGKTITFHVWVPGSNLNVISPFIEDKSNCTYYNWQDCTKLRKNSWNTLNLKVPDNIQLPVQKFGLKVKTQGRFKANIYIDSISY